VKLVDVCKRDSCCYWDIAAINSGTTPTGSGRPNGAIKTMALPSTNTGHIKLAQLSI